MPSAGSPIIVLLLHNWHCNTVGYCNQNLPNRPFQMHTKSCRMPFRQCLKHLLIILFSPIPLKLIDISTPFGFFPLKFCPYKSSVKKSLKQTKMQPDHAAPLLNHSSVTKYCFKDTSNFLISCPRFSIF